MREKVFVFFHGIEVGVPSVGFKWSHFEVSARQLCDMIASFKNMSQIL